jgi:hypothetical protein
MMRVPQWGQVGASAAIAHSTVEDHGAAAHGDRETLVVIVAALLAFRHGSPPFRIL